MSKRVSSKKTIPQIRQELSAKDTALIGIFHNRVISTIINALETFPLRETPLLFGLVTSIIAGVSMLALAGLFAYQVVSLQVLLPIFLLGYLVGIIYEYLITLIKQKP